MLILVVADFVLLKFILPESSVSFWERKLAVGASVPEAAMYKDGEASAGVANVRPSGRFRPVHAVAAQATTPQCFAQHKLRLGVLALVAAHVAAYLFLSRKRGL